MFERTRRPEGGRAVALLAALALVAGVLASARPAEATVCSWGRIDGSGGLWSSDNWEPEDDCRPPNNSPTETYDAVLNLPGFGPKLDMHVTIEKLTMHQTNLDMKKDENGEYESYDLTVNQLFTWDGGSHRGDGTTTVDGVLHIVSGINLGWRTLQVNGGASVAGTGQARESVIDNAERSTFVLQDDARIGGGVASDFQNYGTVVAGNLDAESLTKIGIFFDNAGTLEAKRGTLELIGGGHHRGLMRSVGDAVIAFRGGPHSLETTEMASANIRIQLGTAGFLSVAGEFINDGTTEMVGGDLTGPGSYVENGLFHWRGGDLVGRGTLVSEGELLINGSSRRLGNAFGETARLEVRGGARWDRDNGGTLDSLRLYGDSSILNAADSTFDIQRPDARITAEAGARDAWFENRGTFLKSFGGEALVEVRFDNHWKVDCRAGKLRFLGGGSHEGLLWTEGGECEIELGGSREPHVLRTDDGSNAELLLSGEVVAERDFSNEGGTMLTGTLGGDASYTELGPFRWKKGHQIGDGLTDTRGELRLEPGSKRLGSADETRRLEIWGGAVWPTSENRQDDILVYPGSHIALHSVFDIQRDEAFIRRGGGDGRRRLDIHEGAALRKSSGAGASRVEIPVSNRGVVLVEQGTLDLSSTEGFDNRGTVVALEGTTLAAPVVANHDGGGVLAGWGTFDALVTNEGMVSPGRQTGPKLGILTIASDYQEVAGGGGGLPILRVELGGTVPGEQHDQLSVTGTATLDGALLVEPLDPGYEPEVGDRFEVLVAETIEGCVQFVDTGGFPGVDFFRHVVRGPLEMDRVVLEVVDGVAENDIDGDGVPDHEDNCAFVENTAQVDSNLDGLGNACDADFDDDGKVGIADFNILSAGFGRREGDPGYDPDLDMNGDGWIWTEDYQAYRRGHADRPGPSGLCCAGTELCLPGE